jgi:predicted nucleic acid-binding protein
LTREAVEMRAELKLPYLDAFSATLARERKAELATADSDFAVLEPKRKVVWPA